MDKKMGHAEAQKVSIKFQKQEGRDTAALAVWACGRIDRNSM